MKARPRSVEREVASELSRFFVLCGYEPVERVPILGRSGEDIQSRGGLVVDVKSRENIPVLYRLRHAGAVGLFGTNVGVRLGEIGNLFTPTPKSVSSSIVVDRWMEHAAEWGEIPCLVLHWPGTWVKNATFLIRLKDKELFYERFGKGCWTLSSNK